MLPNSNIKTKLLGSLQEDWLHNGFYSPNMVQIAQQNKLKEVMVLQKVVMHWWLDQLITEVTKHKRHLLWFRNPAKRPNKTTAWV
jgi:hypothetical protein